MVKKKLFINTTLEFDETDSYQNTFKMCMMCYTEGEKKGDKRFKIPFFEGHYRDVELFPTVCLRR